MKIHLPLFEIGDNIEVFKLRSGSRCYTISEIFPDEIITTSGKSIKKNTIAIIHKKYGVKIINPFFQLNF